MTLSTRHASRVPSRRRRVHRAAHARRRNGCPVALQPRTPGVRARCAPAAGGAPCRGACTHAAARASRRASVLNLRTPLARVAAVPAVPTALRLALAATGLFATAAAARAPGDPIRLVWDEGDVAGLTSIYAPDGDRPIGVIEYHQHRKGDLLTCARIAHFADGSSDEDEAVARIGSTLEAVSGRSIIRDRSG